MGGGGPFEKSVDSVPMAPDYLTSWEFGLVACDCLRMRLFVLLENAKFYS